MIHVFWTDLSATAPWWVGPTTRQRPRTVYWQPLAELVERRVNAEIDTSGWGSDVLVELTLPELLNAEIQATQGFAVAQLALPAAINRSRDLGLVLAALEHGVRTTVERIARELGVDLHPTRNAPLPDPAHPRRIATLADRFGGVLALVAPTATEEFLASLRVDELRWEGYEGWRAVQPRETPAGRPVSDVDFSSVDVPVLLDQLAANGATALVVVGKDLDRLTGWLPTGLPSRVSVVGRDDGCWWAAIG